MDNRIAPNRVARIRDRLHGLWKLCSSVRKRDWELGDYPVVIRQQKVDSKHKGTRLEQGPYSAFIVNWGLTGGGDSEREALEALRQHFAAAKAERTRSGTPLPRPGTRVPAQFASQERVSAHPELTEDFVHRVLELKWAWISDESSLWDFHQDETNDPLIARIKELYNVDVSDIKSARLSEILERIATKTQDGT
jgi:hypothetical protein